VLAALLFPVFNSARKRAHSSTCVSNLKQIGESIMMYAEDYADKFPFAVDPTDRQTPQIWWPYPEWQQLIPYMPDLHDVLQPYQKSEAIWKCPADNGFLVEDFNEQLLDATPSCYQKFGSSYVWRTEVAFRQIRISSFEAGPRTNVVFDGAGHWHLGWRPIQPDESFISRFEKRRQYTYNVLFGDMHVKRATYNGMLEAWNQEL
jgi:hypothetical protein